MSTKSADKDIYDKQGTRNGQFLAVLGMLCNLLPAFLLFIKNPFENNPMTGYPHIQGNGSHISNEVENRYPSSLLLFTSYQELILIPLLVRILQTLHRRALIIGYANFDSDKRALELMRRFDIKVHALVNLRSTDADIMEQLTLRISEVVPSEVILQPGSRAGLLTSLIFHRAHKHVIVIQNNYRQLNNKESQNDYFVMRRLTQQLCSTCLTSAREDVGELVYQGVSHKRVQYLGSLYSSFFCDQTRLFETRDFKTERCIFLLDWEEKEFQSLLLTKLRLVFSEKEESCIFVSRSPLDEQVARQIHSIGHRVIALNTSTEYLDWLALSSAVFASSVEKNTNLVDLCSDMGIPFFGPVAVLKQSFVVHFAKHLPTYLNKRFERCREAKQRIETFKRILTDLWHPSHGDEQLTTRKKDAIAAAFTPEMRQDKRYVNNEDSIAVILTVYKRHTLEDQLECVYQQSLPADLIFVVQDENHVDVTATIRRYPKVHFVHSSSYNFRYHHRFSIGLLLPVEYMAIIDDDLLPQSMWLWNSVRCVKQNYGICGAIGRSPERGIKFGDFEEPVESDTEATFVGHAWTFRREWLYDFFSEAPLTFYTSEDHQFSGFLRLKRGIKSYVAMQPAENRSLWPDDPSRSWQTHMDDVASYLDPGREKWRASVSRYFTLMGVNAA